MTAALLPLLAEHYTDFSPDQDEVERLLERSASFADLESLAAHLARYQDSVLYDAQAQAVTLSTLHAAKGLEFDVVFLCGCEEGQIPLKPRVPLAGEALAEHLAEERRLFYVGMTRARKTLYCTWTASRPGFAPSDAESRRQPSPFLAEFDQNLISPAPQLAQAARKKRARARQLELFSGKQKA